MRDTWPNSIPAGVAGDPMSGWPAGRMYAGSVDIPGHQAASGCTRAPGLNSPQSRHCLVDRLIDH